MNSATYKENKKKGISAPRIPVAYSKKQVWYGRVNDWKNIKQTESDIICCAANNVTGYMIEMAGDLPDSSGAKSCWTAAWLKDIEKKYASLVKMTRAAGMWLFVSVVNDNMGKGKYGDKAPKLEKVMKMAKQLVDIIVKYGHDGIIIQPVAETQTKSGKEFEAYCKKVLKKFHMVYNGNVGFPKSMGGFKYRAVHPKNTKLVCPKDALVISDHGLIIVELAKDGKYDGTAKKEKVVEWADTVFKKSGCRVMGYYAFQRSKGDSSTIKILGEVIKKYRK